MGNMGPEEIALISSMFVGLILSWVAVAYLVCANMELRVMVKRLRKHNKELSEAVKNKSFYFRV